MKFRTIIAIIALAVLTVLAFSACDLLGSPVRDRLDSFVSNLNTSSRSSLYMDLDPAATYYSAAKVGSYWDLIFPTGETYTLSNVSSGTSVVSAILKGSGTFGSQTVTFTMVSTGTLVTKSLISKISFAGQTAFE